MDWQKLNVFVSCVLTATFWLFIWVIFIFGKNVEDTVASSYGQCVIEAKDLFVQSFCSRFPADDSCYSWCHQLPDERNLKVLTNATDVCRKVDDVHTWDKSYLNWTGVE